MMVLLLWNGVLLLGAVALFRDAALVEGRLRASGATALDGPELGSLLPHLESVLLPATATYVFLSASCPPCAVIARVLQEFGGVALEVVLKEGWAAADDSWHVGLEHTLPDGVRVHRGEIADALRTVFRVEWEPVAVQIDRGLVVGKGVLRNRHDLERLVRS